ncbi:ABC transporter permease [Pedobacter insulae]|uniref:ABC-2 type transport system permease protein n=1 Tax=Pedobacter insulae TaxID=414048 RepID=A0A1I2VL97_9SPHI|nr:ABC transporter permease [Pedobacter insulae]SFG90058.1 ABC-2 type transport system permease protein [Pedobacter insulae]
MNKILLIIRREYLSRVKKKSFIVMTFLTPLLIAGIYALIGYFTYKGINDTYDKVAVVNDNKILTEKLISDKNIKYEYVNRNLDEMKTSLKKSDYDYVLYLPNFTLQAPNNIQLYGAKQAGLSLNRRISNDIEELIRNQKLKESGIAQSDLDQLKTNVDISTKKIAETGQEEDSSAGASTIIAFIAGILMFMFIMLYGIQVMRGVIEEKTSRIIEVMISSVKPFQLMMGKIIGIAMVGLTQFILWIVLTLTISTAVVSFFANKDDIEKTVAVAKAGQAGTQLSHGSSAIAMQQGPMVDIQKSLAGLPIGKIVTVFIFFFLAGYLFYSALYAAIGSAVDSETETQQFMMPVMMPLLLGYALSLSVVTNDPYGPVAFWLSMIPFTSPIAMVVRLPYGVPNWELALSMFILVVGFIGTVWVAGRIYRVGILMYGKKTTFKEMFKWFSYKG